MGMLQSKRHARANSQGRCSPAPNRKTVLAALVAVAARRISGSPAASSPAKSTAVNLWQELESQACRIHRQRLQPAGLESEDAQTSSAKPRCPLGNVRGLPDGDLLSFTDHAGIDLRRVQADRVWDTFRGHYEHAVVDFDKFLFDFSTWGPIASRVVEIQLEKTRNAASA
jgi:hypothetical protein